MKIWFGKRNAFVRGLAAFFLLFAFADLAFPQIFCREELGGLLNTRAASSSNSHDSSRAIEESVITISNDDSGSLPYEPSREVPHEEDCFCCCAHVLVGINFQPNVPGAVKPLPFAPYPNSVPNPPLHGTYRPPRIA